MTDAQTNQETEEVHVTLTTEPLVVQQQSSSVSSDLVSKFINPSPDIGIDLILNPNVQSDILGNVSIFATTETPSFDTTIPQLPIPIIQSQQQTHDSTTTTTTIPTTTFPEIPNFASLFGFERRIDSNIKAIIKDHVKAQVSKIMPKVEKYVTESLEAEVLARSSNQPQTSYNLYNTWIDSYNSDKDLFASYGDVVTLKRGRDDQDKDEEPSAGSNRGTKQRRSGKEESSKEATQKESKSTISSKEPFHQEFNTGNDDVSPMREIIVVNKRLWNLSGSQTPDHEWNKTKTVDDRPPQSWMT
ncbi:hypothetical protein Tco_0723317 [Tanacetum coccineum]